MTCLLCTHYENIEPASFKNPSWQYRHSHISNINFLYPHLFFLLKCLLVSFKIFLSFNSRVDCPFPLGVFILTNICTTILSFLEMLQQYLFLSKVMKCQTNLIFEQVFREVLACGFISVLV